MDSLKCYEPSLDSNLPSVSSSSLSDFYETLSFEVPLSDFRLNLSLFLWLTLHFRCHLWWLLSITPAWPLQPLSSDFNQTGSRSILGRFAPRRAVNQSLSAPHRPEEPRQPISGRLLFTCLFPSRKTASWESCEIRSSISSHKNFDSLR